MKRKQVLQWLLGIAGILLIAGGIMQGEYGVTMNKAIRICLECIGIG